MAHDERQPDETLTLKFKAQEDLGHVGDPIHRDISAIAIVGNNLFAACDETASIERLTLDAETGTFTDHQSFKLGDVFDLPDGEDGEMDIEGLSETGGKLWIAGSHSLKRNTPDDGDFSKLQDVAWDPNRAFLGYLPLLDDGENVEPVGRLQRLGKQELRGRHLKFKGDRGYLRKLLKDDPLLGPYMDIPCKENGFDIEGLAAQGSSVWLGLRGPVLGGHAIIVALDVKVTKKDMLKPRRQGGGPRYRLIALDLHGQGIRDLLYDEKDERLLILSGATTDLEALQSVYAVNDWPRKQDVVTKQDITPVLRLPTLRGKDHAEGIGFLERDGKRQLVVAHDAPRPDRVADEDQSLKIDLYDLPLA
ncbi:DUF3616 domain-containing protein [Parvularcula sp. ZS-1/3]|uniref:DUF3616 domain-containing protein n=1 Tax=Parvularcula mediterranea TaxID=2732508 RepID=A0A7Y3RM51_9PROT|nr:DUF3616 domain-containing protein [Parvularcula mediterranea]NNU16549.1 DUF3616 domain-containing protein [Parvularcula mediterranea]